jgi:hypothetical protein
MQGRGQKQDRCRKEKREDENWRAAASECQLGLGSLVVYSLFILPVRFIGLSGQTGTEPNRQDFMVLKIGLIDFLSRFGFLS